MVFPSVIPALMTNGIAPESLEVYQYVIVFLTYFGLAFIATFFNVCVVYTTKARFEGGNATFSESLSFAFTRIPVIAQWSLVSATVGLLLRILQQLASNLGKVGQIVANILIVLLGMAWSILAIFVVPVLVYENVGTIDAIKKSAAVIKKTWGKSLIKTIGLGLVRFLVVLGIVAFSGALTYGLMKAFDITGLLVGIGTGMLLLFVTGLVFRIANSIFNTALYVYANNNLIAPGFGEDVVKGAFREKGR